MVRRPSRARRCCAILPTPKISVTGFGARKAAASSPPRTAKPRGLSRSEAILARNLLQESPIDTVMPSEVSTSLAKPASALAGDILCRRAVPDRSMNASSIDTGSTNAGGLDKRPRTPPPPPRVFPHVRPNDAGVRAQPPRLEHRHGGAHAERARDVAGGEHDAALAAADDHRLVGERRIVAFLDGGVEGVAIDVGDRQRVDLRMAQQPRRAAGGAAPGSLRHVAAAIAAEAGHRSLARCAVAHGRLKHSITAWRAPHRPPPWAHPPP